MQFAIFLCVRAITSCCVNLCKIEKGSLFTHFGSKNIHISWDKIVHLCTIAIVTMHICTATVAFAYHILVFFFSLTLSSSLYPLLLSRFHLTLSFSQQIRTVKNTLSSHFLSSHSSSFHNCRSPPISHHHYHRFPLPPIVDISIDL